MPAGKRNSATFAVIFDLAPGYAILGPRVGWSCLKAPKCQPWSTARLVSKIGCLGDCRALAQWHKAVKILLAAGTFTSRLYTPTETVLRLFGVHKQGELERLSRPSCDWLYPATFLHHH